MSMAERISKTARIKATVAGWMACRVAGCPRLHGAVADGRIGIDAPLNTRHKWGPWAWGASRTMRARPDPIDRAVAGNTGDGFALPKKGGAERIP